MINTESNNRTIKDISSYNVNIINNDIIDVSNIDSDYKNNICNLFWYTNPHILDILIKYCNINKLNNILEIGPGTKPFPLATIFIGSNEKIREYINIDIDEENIPFNDNTFDFLYIRHVLEDIQSPNRALNEIFRVSKSGYFEIPSIMVELTKNVSNDLGSHLFIGYPHHRYIICPDIEENVIHILPKYGFLENLLNIDKSLQESIYYMLNIYPVYWNSYFIWNENNVTPKIIMYKNGINIGLNCNLFNNYAELIHKFIFITIKNTNYFINNYSHLLDID